MNHHDTNSSALLGQSVAQFLDALGSAAPAPGGGAGSALAGALGAALVQMAANLTLGKKKFADVQEQARAAIDAAGDQRARLAALVQADADAFAAVSQAYRLPQADGAQQAHRSEAIQASLVGAANVPQRIARASADVLTTAEQFAPHANPNVVSDVVVGAELAYAALCGAAINVEVNAALMDDERLAGSIRSELAEHQAGALQRLEHVRQIGADRLPRRAS